MTDPKEGDSVEPAIDPIYWDSAVDTSGMKAVGPKEGDMEPRSEAGRPATKASQFLRNRYLGGTTLFDNDMAAIETEAHNLALDAVAEAVGRLPVEALEGHGPIGLVEERDRTVDVIGRSAVLRIIEEARHG